MIGKDIKLIKHGDERGQLIAVEAFSDVIDFDIKRVYYIFDNVSNVRRGFHAHKKLKQLLVCTSGSCKIHLDNGKETREVLLDSPDKGLIIDEYLWREMYDFAPGTVLMVLASEKYNEEDYIRNYDDFIKSIK